MKPLSELLDPLHNSTTQALDNIELERNRLRVVRRRRGSSTSSRSCGLTLRLLTSKSSLHRRSTTVIFDQLR